MVIIGLLILFVLLVIYLLWVPINIVINSNTNDYYLQVKGLAKLSVEGDQEKILKVKLILLFYHYYFYPLMYKPKEKKKKLESKNMTKIKRKIGFKTILKLLKSFEVKKFLIDIDTGDCILNAKMFPIFGFLNYYVSNFKVNFEGRNQIVLHLQNRPFNIIKAFINIKK